jgi:spermidine synthase
MSWRSYLFPQTILITSSLYNRHIRVNEEWGKMKLLVNGSPQSGSYIANLWNHAFDHFSIQIQKPENALVLGIGGATVVSLLSDYFPQIVQTCIDIDKVIIDIAKKYFSVSSIPNISVIHADAKPYVKQLIARKKTYDCIIIDLFIGSSIPPFVGKKQFILSIYKLLSPKGFLCINYLCEMEYQAKSDYLYTILQSVFAKTTEYKIARNLFFYARK